MTAREPRYPLALPEAPQRWSERTVRLATPGGRDRVAGYRLVEPLDASGAPLADAPTVLAVHGLRGDRHGLDLIARCLPGARIVVPDLPGHGVSEVLPGAHDLDAYVSFLDRLVTALGLDGGSGPEASGGLAMLGHSFGSIVAAAFARRHPERLRALVLVNPVSSPALRGPRAALSWATEAYYVAGAALPRAVGEPLLRSRAVVDLVSSAMTCTRSAQVRDFIRAEHRARFAGFADRRSLLDSYRAATRHHAAEDAHALAVPTLLIAGARDDVSPVAAQEALAAAAPDARLVVIAGSGHLLHYEEPAAVAEHARDFLAERGLLAAHESGATDREGTPA
ncbi:alpha/beta fold hydrolase [Demequina pelophila]|uniref:alpha/beta fold hydrolase n=1 Tax=Demequina pelophila TaxID=1638984 RepID=UPI0009E1CA74|nr:alpha/beta hydrolase [Demequina pelophila]